LGGLFPSGLVVGRVEEVRLADNDLFQAATVRPAVKYDEIDLVIILKKF